MARWAWMTVVGAMALAWWAAPQPASGQARTPTAPAPARTPYGQLDDTRLATVLQTYGMTELLEALVKSAAIRAEDVEKTAVLIQAKIAEAGKPSTTPAQRNKLLDEAIALQDKVVEATRTASTYADKVKHFRFALDRVIAEGITKVEPYADRMMYLQGKADDGPTIIKWTAKALTLLDRLQTRMQDAHEKASEDTEYLITGASQQMELLMLDARYRGAWIRFYEGMSLPKDAAERAALLKRTLEDVTEFANYESSELGPKFRSLLLCGMAARELGDLPKARDFLQRASHKDAGEWWQLRALFELCHAEIELGSPAEGEKALQDFAAKGLEVLTDKRQGQVAVDMQSALLRSHYYESRAEAVKVADPKAAEKFRDEALKALLTFIGKYPQFANQFLDVIAPKYEGKDPATIPPRMLIPLGMKKYQEKTTGALEEAAKYFDLAAKDKESSPETKALALYDLGWVRNEQKRNLEAARAFRQLGEEFPNDPHAAKAPLLAVASLQGVLAQQNKEPIQISMDFAKEYVRALEVLLKRVGPRDPKASYYYYELGMTRAALGLNKEALEALKQISPADEYYVPGQYHVLRSQLNVLREDAALKPDAKRQLASTLIDDLNNYRDRAKEYADKAKDDKRKEQVRGWAAEADLLVAELMNDFLDQSAEAIRRAQEVIQRWANMPAVRRRCQEFIVRMHLKRNELDQAVALIEGLEGADALVGQVVQQMSVRMEQRRYRADPESVRAREEDRKTLKAFAERLHRDAVDRKEPEDKMYGIKQALAGAYEEGSQAEAAKAQGLYEELLKKNADDAINIRGLARCFRQMKKNEEAMKLYDELVDRLAERSPDWWRMHLERLQFALEISAQKVKALKDMQLQIGMLRFKDEQLGGYLKQFNDVEGRVKEMLRGAGAPGGK